MEKLLLQIRMLMASGQIEEAYTIAKQIEDNYWRGYAFKWIAEGIVGTDPEKALKIAKKIENESLRNDTLLLLSYELGKLRKFKEAINAAKLIKNNYLKKKAFRGISNSFARAIMEINAKEVRLSDFNLEEEEVEYLMPLPGNIKYKDGKFLVDSEIHYIKGEIKLQVLSSEPSYRKHSRIRFNDKNQKEEDLKHIFTYVDRLISKNQLQEAEKLVTGLEDPHSFYLLEEIGMRYLHQGDIERAKKVLERLDCSDYLANEFVKFYLNMGDIKKVKEYAIRLFNPAFKLNAAYSILLIQGIDERFLRDLFSDVSTYKLGRLLKFLAFELLKEAKKRKSDRLLKLSKNIFLLGKKEFQEIS